MSTDRPKIFASPQEGLLTLLIILVAVVAAFPMAWMVLASLKTPQESMQTPPVWFPATPNLDAYVRVADVVSLGQSFLNSAVIAVITTCHHLSVPLAVKQLASNRIGLVSIRDGSHL